MPLIFAAIWIALEVTMFIMVGDALGIGTTLILVAISAACGFVIIRHHGIVFLQNARQSRQNGSMISFNIADTSMAVIGGIFLIIPGFLSDSIGLILLLRPLRNILIPHGERLFKVKVEHDQKNQTIHEANHGAETSSRSQRDTIIDLEKTEWSHKDNTPPK